MRNLSESDAGAEPGDWYVKMRRIGEWTGYAIVLLVLAAGCETVVYAPSSSSTTDVGQARETVLGLLSNKATFRDRQGTSVRVNDVKLRNDGIALVFQEVKVNLLSSNEMTPPTIKACYFAGMDVQVVNSAMLGTGVPICGLTAWFKQSDDARLLADALYVLKKR
jgi:hypothetical protein